MPFRRRVEDVPGHPQVNEEVPPAFEDDNQILASSAHVGYPLPLEGSRHRLGRFGPRQPGIADLDPLERSSRQPRREQRANRLDFG
jgi:hypothetical protein